MSPVTFFPNRTNQHRVNEMSNVIQPSLAYTVFPPSTTHDHEVPVVFDSPHSGTRYPADFGHIVDSMTLRRAEDTHVEALYAAAPELGATLIAANFPRSYIDANRSLLDIDAALLDSAWPGPINVSRKTEKGSGWFGVCSIQESRSIRVSSRSPKCSRGLPSATRRTTRQFVMPSTPHTNTTVPCGISTATQCRPLRQSFLKRGLALLGQTLCWVIEMEQLALPISRPSFLLC